MKAQELVARRRAEGAPYNAAKWSLLTVDRNRILPRSCTGRPGRAPLRCSVICGLFPAAWGRSLSEYWGVPDKITRPSLLRVQSYIRVICRLASTSRLSSIPPPKMASFDQKCVNTVRLLGADMVEKANSGHPGLFPFGRATLRSTLKLPHRDALKTS